MESPEGFYSCGTRCAAVLWLPDEAEGPVPGVVLCHGFRGIKEWFLPDLARDFNARGWAALTFDYRGFGESDGPRGRLVPADQVEDIRNAITFLQSRPGVDPERIALYGTSFGGANVVSAAALDERAKAIVCQVGVADVGKVASAVRERLSDALDADRERRVLTGESETIDPADVLNNPQSAAAFAEAEQRFPSLRQRFPLEAVERIFEYRPVAVVGEISPRACLFLGASLDQAVPVEETRLLHAAAGEPKRLEIFDITHYEIYQSPHRERAIDLACSFFEEHVPPPAADG